MYWTPGRVCKNFFLEKYHAWEQRVTSSDAEIFLKKHSEISDTEYDCTLELIKNTVCPGRLKDQEIIEPISDKQKGPPIKIKKVRLQSSVHTGSDGSSSDEETAGVTIQQVPTSLEQNKQPHPPKIPEKPFKVHIPEKPFKVQNPLKVRKETRSKKWCSVTLRFC